MWPIKDEIEQLRIFQEKVAPLVDRRDTVAINENRSGWHLTMIMLWQ
jgi:hypothetical protein